VTPFELIVVLERRVARVSLLRPVLDGSLWVTSNPRKRGSVCSGFRSSEVSFPIIGSSPERGDLNLAQDAVRRTESWVGQRKMNSPAGTAETSWLLHVLAAPYNLGWVTISRAVAKLMFCIRVRL
jgi:hypothetical protein